MAEDPRLVNSTREHGSMPELVGRYACKWCGHDQWLHNRIDGCPYCKCAATSEEANGNRHTPAPPERYAEEWMRPDPDTKPEAQPMVPSVVITRDRLVEELRKDIELLEFLGCQFFACEGPDKEPEDMVTCRVCWRINELRAMLPEKEKV